MVTICDAHQRLVNTSPNQLPGRLHLKLPQFQARLAITYLFARLPGAQREKSSALPAALKQTGRFKISKGDRLAVLRRAIRIGSHECSSLQCDAIVPMPSTSDLVPRICRVLRARLPNHPPILELLKKRSNAEVLALAPGIHRISEPQRELYQKECWRLARLTGTRPFEAKRVPVRLRRYFSPLELREQPILPNIRSLLIVDDVVSTGSSFPQCSDAFAFVFHKRHCPRVRALWPHKAEGRHGRLLTCVTGIRAVAAVPSPRYCEALKSEKLPARRVAALVVLAFSVVTAALSGRERF